MLKRHPLITFIFFGFVLFLISNRLDELRVYQGATVAIYAIGIGSIILLTGYSGQVSLGHGALLAIGGYAAALARIHYNAPVWLTFVVAVLAAAAGGALLGLAAARLSGPQLDCHLSQINFRFSVANKVYLSISVSRQLLLAKISLNTNGSSGFLGPQLSSHCIG